MSSYDITRQLYRPEHIKLLLVAESQPPQSDVQSSRHFYRSEMVRKEDRLFTNTIRALYPDESDASDVDLEQNKERWLRQLQHDGVYMIEALQQSLAHEVTKRQRQELIKKELPNLIERLRELVSSDTKVILIKSNVFDVATEPLRQAGFTILNKALVDYPGRFNQGGYKEKLATLATGVLTQ